MKQNKYHTYIWACEFNNYSGEGKLALLFLKYLKNNKKIGNFVIETPRGMYKNFKSKKITNDLDSVANFYSKYITPFVGIYKIYKNQYFHRRKTIYINYAPIWNFVLFLLLPKKTILGPITGSDFFKISNMRSFTRFCMIKILNTISKLIIRIKYRSLIFSTNLVDFKKNKHQNLFQLQYIAKKKIRKIKTKKIDLIFYYRNHPNKYNNYEINYLKKLIKSGKKIKIVGDFLPELSKYCTGYLSQEKLIKLLDRSKFTISSFENPFSFFIQDALLSNVNIIFHKQQKKLISEYYEDFFLIDFSKNNFFNLKNTNKKTKLKSIF